jgi:hypothetical protein
MPHPVHKLVDELVGMGCDAVIAWRLLSRAEGCTAARRAEHRATEHRDPTITSRQFQGRQMLNLGHAPFWREIDSGSDKLVQSVKIVSGFRTALVNAVENAKHNPMDKKLLGSKEELRKKQNHGDTRFTVDRSIFVNAQSQMVVGHSALKPFTAAMFDLDPLDTNMDMLHHLIQKAKKSDLNQGGKQQARSTFNARSVAVLATLDGKEVSGSAVSKHVRVQYFYQDDEKTKSLCTPFSQLILFANTNEQDVGVPEEV